MRHRSLLVLGLVGACTPARPPALHPDVQHGPASGVKPNRVLVLQAACGSVEAKCPNEYIDVVDAIVRGGLEFSGLNLVESEKLRNQTRERHEEHDSSTSTKTSQTDTTIEHPILFDEHSHVTNHTTTADEHSKIVLDGSGFEDLSIDERHEVVAKSGADAVVVVRIVIGGQVGVWVPNQNVEVMVKLGVNQGDSMAWAARCTASSNDFTTVNAALENAARCAIYGATGK
jgi:hypothetical protein